MDTLMERVTDTERICDILRRFDNCFPRSLTSRLGDLSVHAQKLSTHAFVYVARRDDLIAGFIAFYANDSTSLTAFLTHLAVDARQRGGGIGLMLLRQCLQVSRDAGMKKVLLEVDTANLSAIRFYATHGFLQSGSASPHSCFMQLDGI